MKSMNSRFVFGAIVCLALLLTAQAAWAQSTTEGAIAGTVTDPSGAVVSGANVAARNNGTNQEFTTTTDSSGYYRINLVPPGTYTLRFPNGKSYKVTVS